MTPTDEETTSKDACVVERLGVGDLERQVEPELAGLALRHLDQRRGQI